MKSKYQSNFLSLYSQRCLSENGSQNPIQSSKFFQVTIPDYRVRIRNQERKHSSSKTLEYRFEARESGSRTKSLLTKFNQWLNNGRSKTSTRRKFFILIGRRWIFYRFSISSFIREAPLLCASNVGFVFFFVHFPHFPPLSYPIDYKYS